MKTLVLGLGNPILGDDGIGINIARELRKMIHNGAITVMESNVSGLNLLQLLIDYDRAIVIDAIQTREGKPGYIYHLEPDELRTSEYVTHCHSSSLGYIIQLGKRLGLKMPQQMDIFAVEAADVSTFSGILTPEVEEAMPVCLNMIATELGLLLDSSKSAVKP